MSQEVLMAATVVVHRSVAGLVMAFCRFRILSRFAVHERLLAYV